MMMITRDQSKFLQKNPRRSSMNPPWNGGGLETIGGNNGIVGTNPRKHEPCLSQNSVLASFLTESSVDGLKYIAQKDRHWSERLFWLVAFLLGISSSAYLIHGVWDRYHQTPVIVTFDVNEVDTNSIPFPAVTICNNNMISKLHVEKLERTLTETNYSDPKRAEAEENLRFVRFLCQPKANISGDFGKQTEDLIGFYIKLWIVEMSELSDMQNSDPCGEMIQRCRFGSEPYNCSTLFKPIITNVGKCCTFNILPLGLLFRRLNKTDNGEDDNHNYPTDDFVEEQYFTKAVGIGGWREWRPMKQRRAGLPNGLTIYIDAKIDDYYCPFRNFEGFSLDIHSPFEIPLMWEFSSAVQIGKKTFFEVNADITRADPDIRDYPQEKRKCYFENEKQLKYYRPYTRRNCVDECVADYFATKCGCKPLDVPSYHPEHTGKQVCSQDRLSAEFKCLLRQQSMLDDELERLCPACEPLCEEIKYTRQVSIVNLLPPNPLWDDKFDPLLKDKSTRTLAIVHIFFGSERTVPKLRKALYGWTDLIANTGGILGLCLGFSVISGIELVYFFTLRAFWSKQGQGVSARKCVAAAVNSLKHLFRSRTNVINVPPCQLAEDGI